MSLGSLIKRLKARFRPSVPVPDSAPAEGRAVPRHDLFELWDGVPAEIAGEVLDDMLQDFEEDMAELEDAFRGQN